MLPQDFFAFRVKDQAGNEYRHIESYAQFAAPGTKRFGVTKSNIKLAKRKEIETTVLSFQLTPDPKSATRLYQNPPLLTLKVFRVAQNINQLAWTNLPDSLKVDDPLTIVFKDEKQIALSFENSYTDSVSSSDSSLTYRVEQVGRGGIPYSSNVARVAPQRTPYTPKPNIETVYIPAGEFLMGSKDGVDNEQPQRSVYVDAFEIARYPLTNAQYKAFLDAKPKYSAPPSWTDRSYPSGKADHPVVEISWHDAMACADWYGMRLPTEAEWEKAARGIDGRVYPWGNTFDSAKCNTHEGGPGDTTPVGRYPEGASPYEILDMAGNVWEWCADWYDEDYYKKGENRNPKGPETGNYRVVRGGSWSNDLANARCAYRDGGQPDDGSGDLGVRFSRTL